MTDEPSTCRDFERGVCNRGDNCKYYHPEKAAPAEGQKLPICKDFQNKGCGRFKCKFLHITIDEEAEYNSTGKLPEHGGHPEISAIPSLANKDVCRDFLKGKCDRGSRCRYSHAESEPHMNGAGMGGMYGKRPRTDDFYGAPRPGDAVLLEENEYLRCKVTDLQKEAVELRQMNDTLYEQNGRYRSQLQKGSTNVSSQVSTYSPAVFPQYSQAAYPAKSAALPMPPTAGIGPYSYQQY